MYLSDTTIKEYLRTEKIVFSPSCDEADIRPAGIRLHLSGKILVPNNESVIDLGGTQDVHHDEVLIPQEGYLLEPGAFVLGSTVERFQVPRDILCHIDGRSTFARLGLMVHCSSATVDGNFDESRSVVLEIKNLGPSRLLLRPNVPVAMLLFSKLISPIEQNSQKQYSGQDSVIAPDLSMQRK